MNSQLQLALSEILHEATLLNLSIEKAEFLLGWKPKWAFEETISKTVEWYDQVHQATTTSLEITGSQIAQYCGNAHFHS